MIRSKDTTCDIIDTMRRLSEEMELMSAEYECIMAEIEWVEDNLDELHSRRQELMENMRKTDRMIAELGGEVKTTAHLEGQLNMFGK